jgi:aminomethyltransferase
VSEFLPGEIGPKPEPDTPAATPLDALHRRLGGRMVGFAGYLLPVQYPAGIIAEHQQCRERAALFDVSHMGQASLHGAEAAAALERLVPGDLLGLKPGRERYTLLLNEAGGIIDDLMVTHHGDRLVLVLNAARKRIDLDHLAARLPGSVRLEPHDDRALLALQGPAAAAAMARLAPEAASLGFMAAGAFPLGGAACWISRSGYTGEDGFEISIPAGQAEAVAERLLAEPEVAPAGLGARDSLRLEAGLCLYGNDIDELTTPVEAGLTWTIGKRRRTDWDFPGAAAIRDQLDNGPTRLRVGLRPEGRAPARAGTLIAAEDGTEAGTVTSGSFAPSLGAPVAMGYVRRDLAADGTALSLIVRGRRLPAVVSPLPFVPHRYRR